MNKKLSKKTAIELACKTGGEKQASSLRTEKKHEHGKHPNSIKNLKPYETGQSGNPGGRSIKYAKMKKALDNMHADLSPTRFKFLCYLSASMEKI